MAVKKIENFNIHENPATNENEFDIENYLNANWNKIKEVVDNNADELIEAQENIADLQEDNETNKTNIANKVDKVEGKGLSTEDFTTELKTKLEGLNNYDDTEIKEDIAEIQTEQTSQNEKIENIEDNQIHITTEQSSTINVQDCSNLSAKIDVFGVSKQETRSGKNFFDVSKDLTSANTDYEYTHLDNGYRIKLTQATSGARYMVYSGQIHLEQGQYIFSCLLTVSGGTKNNRGRVRIYNSSGSIIYPVASDIDCNNELKYASFNIEEATDITIAFYYVSNSTIEITENANIYCEWKNIQIEKSSDTQPTEYEKYGASPSPEFPSEIENAGDNINYFDVSKITSGSIVINNNDGTLIIKNNPNTSGYVQQTKKLSELCPDLKVGDTATLGFKTTTKNSSYANSIYVGEAWNNGTYKTITQSMLDFQVGFYGGYNEISTISDIKIEKGTKVTSYSNYGCGSIGTTVSNKNFLPYPYDNVTNTIIQDLEDGRLILNGSIDTNISRTIKTFDLKAGNYKFLFNTSNLPNTSYFYIRNEATKVMLKSNIRTNTTFNLEEDTNIRIELVLVAGEYSNFELDLMILNATEVNEEWKAHEEQLITFPLQENQKLCKKDYLANNGIHHVLQFLELQGTEIFAEYSPTIYNPLNICAFRLQQTLPKNADTSLALSTHFSLKDLAQNNINPEANKFSYYTDEGRSDNGLYFFLNYEDIGVQSTDTSEQKIEKFKNWLVQQKTNNTSVIVGYGLSKENEVIEPYTEAQQEAYNQLQNVTPYKLVTNISTDKAKLQFNYIADTKTYIDNKVTNTQKQLNTINELLSTANTSAMLLDNLQTDLESEVL